VTTSGARLMSTKGAPLPVRTRMAAADRRDMVIDAAVAEFGAHGWYGARIEAIAARAEISHPYLVRLFVRKRELFLAAVDRAFTQMETTFAAAVAAAGDGDAILAIGEAYRHMLADNPATVRLHMHALAVAADDEVGPDVTSRFQQFLAHMRSIAGASDDRVRTCFAVGLTLTVVTALNLPDRPGDLRWGAKLLASGAPDERP